MNPVDDPARRDAMLVQLRQSIQSGEAAPGPRIELDDDTLRHLEALGYLR